MCVSIDYYFDYLSISHWFTFQAQAEADPLTDFARGYEDYLQCPLQPLMDNLESQTYEVFEKDPVKYREYERAMYMAISDRIPEEEKDTKEM